MEKVEFCGKIKDMVSKINIKITDEQSEKFYLYMKELLIWNEKINLTAIKDEDEILIKHFVDSVTIIKYMKDVKNIIDIGTGAGFPGIPIAILKGDIKITLLDSLNKRIVFLNNIIEKLKLKNVEVIHGRAEDFAKLEKYREKYDIVTSRAVAPLNILIEYMLPFSKVNGESICMKGSNIEEVKQSHRALNELGGKIQSIDTIYLPDTDIERNIIIVKKIKSTHKKYPRKAGMPKKEPL